MEKINVEYDPTNGLWTQTGFVDDKLVIHHESDLSAAVERATALRNAEQYSRDGIKSGFWHVAEIPMEKVLELKKIGVDIFAPRCTAKEIVAGLRKLGAEHFLTTTKRV